MPATTGPDPVNSALGATARRLPRWRHRRLAPVVACFCIAVSGNLLCLGASIFQAPALYPPAFAIAVLGITAGFFFILHGWWALLGGRAPGKR